MSIEEVVAGGYCIGCGVCRAVEPRIQVEFNRWGDLEARLPSDAESEAVGRVCPFADGTSNESEIARGLFAGIDGIQSDESIGHFLELHAGYAPVSRPTGASGGVATWLLERLLIEGHVDAVIHVGRSAGNSTDPATARFFDFRVSTSVDALREGATSFYYPVSYDRAIDFIAQNPGRYAITGVPCFHKALRQLRAVDPVFDKRIVLQVGIVCGQMKSAHYLEYLAKRAGVPSDEALVGACFRRKVAGFPANDYAFEAVSQGAGPSAPRIRTVMNSQIGVNWGMGYFKPAACDFCDDVFAETADVAVMDAWLPQYVRDSDGWSLVVTRSPVVRAMLASGASDASLLLEPVTADDVKASQLGGLNHRRVMLGYRRWLRRNEWHPEKRIAARSDYPWILKVEQRLRSFLRRRSREVFVATRDDSASAFARRMKPYEMLYRIVARLKRRLAQ